MATHYYRYTEQDGKPAFAKLDLPAGQELILPAGATEVTQQVYDAGMAAAQKALDALTAGSDAEARKELERLDAARKTVLEKLTKLGLPASALNTLLPGLNLPDDDDGEGE
ncbi:hypothetical protein QRX50_31685 [Amycolatopsis carbonis]|uniref:Uncharacterized protein n=1 Tax=Amycolatopsis carbonis TaxID=715471 RepID=A0A9Y2IAB2_9PSEU|nr:hypothetical protein [Amycolatopsis sp. 2-15]WIX76022.1 hypothetical protein QRX50_31685 [Amycolatopsis sp. 2-15]